ncbi:MAG: polyprenyl diphosphate synthase [Candidatus Hadarchaeia archaeon]
MDFPLGKLPGVEKIYQLFSGYYENRLKTEVENGSRLPKHIGIILDGNRRFASERGLSRWNAHKLGAEKLREVLNWTRDLGIRHVTVYAFSKENLSRDPEEVEELMELFEEKFKEVLDTPEIEKNEVRVRGIGDLSLLPGSVRKAIERAEERTSNFDRYSLNIAVGYTGRSELAEAVQKICRGVEEGEIDPGEVDEKMIGENLYTSDLPDPDLIIRTSGEERLSGFLLWQSAYSELYFCEANWPNFDKINFLRAIRNYQGRERRFGE